MKRLLLLDMWADQSVTTGPSKQWLHACLGETFDVQAVNADNIRRESLMALCRTFSFSRRVWGERYYEALEHLNKRPEVFEKRTGLFNAAIAGLPVEPHVVLQIGGLFGPVNMSGVPYYTYHDQTVRMVERYWPGWLPQDFATIRERWYALEANLYRSVTKVITYSEKARQSMINDYQVLPEKVLVIPTACKMQPATDAEMAPPKSKQIVFVSTGFYRKGGDLVLDAARIIRKHHPDARILIVGGKVPTDVSLDANDAEHVGCLSLADLRRLYLESSLILHPARYDAFPNVLKEALACGLPAVASDSGGIPEIISNGETGMLVKELSPETIADAVIYLLDRPEVLTRMRIACKERRDRFSLKAVCGQFRATLEAE